MRITICTYCNDLLPKFGSQKWLLALRWSLKDKAAEGGNIELSEEAMSEL